MPHRLRVFDQTHRAQIAEGCFFAFVITVMTTPAGVSGAVLLLPVQVSVLGVPSPAVTPTNLLYNIVATPGGLIRYWHAGTLRGGLAKTLALVAALIRGNTGGTPARESTATTAGTTMEE